MLDSELIGGILDVVSLFAIVSTLCTILGALVAAAFLNVSQRVAKKVFADNDVHIDDMNHINMD